VQVISRRIVSWEGAGIRRADPVVRNESRNGREHVYVGGHDDVGREDVALWVFIMIVDRQVNLWGWTISCLVATLAGRFSHHSLEMTAQKICSYCEPIATSTDL
jgi:hypothetical protein